MKNSEKVINRESILGKTVLILSICMVIGLYWRWFLPGAITWGDWFYFSKSSICDFVPTLWYARSGLGAQITSSSPIWPIQMLEVFLCRTFNLDYCIIERLLIFLPLVFFLIFSPLFLGRTLGFGLIAQAGTILVFNLNSVMFLNATVPLLALSDALAPLVFALFIRSLREPRLKIALFFAFSVALQVMIEIRGSYITLLFCILFLIYSTIVERKIRYNLLHAGKTLLLAAFVVTLLHSYWVIPLLFGKTSGTGGVLLTEGYRSAGALTGLSYMTLLHSIGINVPFWGRSEEFLKPVNPQFLLLPMIAFSLLLSGRQKRKTTFFALTALIFSFLVKGSKPPLGGINVWLFLHFPGFFMFRTPGKWYMPLILSYAVLVGYLIHEFVSTESINNAVHNLKRRFHLHPFIIKTGMSISAVAVIFLIFPVQPLSSLYFSAIFEPRKIPDEMSHLENFLHSQMESFRILWLPNIYRFGYFSPQHSAIMGYSLGEERLSPLLTGDHKHSAFSYLGRSFSTWLLRLFSVKYIIVPSAPANSAGEIYYWFGHPPEYYHQLAEKTSGLQPVSFKSDSKLYEVPDPLPRFYLAKDSIAVIDEDIGNFPAISTIAPAKDATVLLLSSQISKRTLKNINTFVLCDSHWKDLAIEVAGYRTGQESARENIEKTALYEVYFDMYQMEQKETPIQPGGKSVVYIKNAGIHEVYFDISEIEENTIPVFDVKVDGRQTLRVTSMRDHSGGAIGQGSRKYTKVGDVKLKEGKHELEVREVSAHREMRGKKIKLFLVNKEELDDSEKFVLEKLNKKENEFCYIFRKKGEFYVPRGADYLIRAKVLPRLFTLRKKSEIRREFKFGKEELKNWSIRPWAVTFDYSTISDGTLILYPFFDGDRNEDEYIQMQYGELRIDLKKFPWFDLTYRIENPEVQTIEIVAGIDFDRDGNVDEYITQIYPKPASTSWATFSYNLYKKAKSDFPGKEYYDLIKLELYPHKLWWVDCANPGRRREYRFWIKNLEFYRISQEEVLQVVENTLDAKMDSEGESKRWSTKLIQKDYSLETKTETLALIEKPGYLELSRFIDIIDLSQFPIIELEYKGGGSSPQSTELIVDLDYNRDTSIDESIFLDYVPASPDWNKFQIDAYELIKNLHADKKKYNLMRIKLRLREPQHPLYIRRLRVYSRSLVSPVNFTLNKPVFELDGERYPFHKKFRNMEEAEEGVWLEHQIHLDEGNHQLESIADESYEVKWMVLEPAENRLSEVLRIKEKPKIEFRKVNQTRYEVNIEGAREAFWLVFNENFHKQWHIFLNERQVKRAKTKEEIVAEYPHLGVKERRHTERLAPLDIKYLYRKPLDAQHHLVNGYANAWRIDPKKSGLPENFTLDVYFLPQSLFYLGLGISFLTLMSCFLILLPLRER